MRFHNLGLFIFLYLYTTIQQSGLKLQIVELFGENDYLSIYTTV